MGGALRAHLVEIEDTGHVGVQGHRVPRALAELLAGWRRQQRRRDCERFLKVGAVRLDIRLDLVDEVYAGNDVSPLV